MKQLTSLLRNHAMSCCCLLTLSQTCYCHSTSKRCSWYCASTVAYMFQIDWTIVFFAIMQACCRSMIVRTQPPSLLQEPVYSRTTRTRPYWSDNHIVMLSPCCIYNVEVGIWNSVRSRLQSAIITYTGSCYLTSSFMAERALKDQRSILCTRARALPGTKNITNRKSYLFSHLSNYKGHCINKISKMREVINMSIQRHKVVIRQFQNQA